MPGPLLSAAGPTEHQPRPQHVLLPMPGPAWRLSWSFVNSSVSRDSLCPGFLSPLRSLRFFEQ